MDATPDATVVLVPAFEPGRRLVDLVAELRATAPHLPLVVVDDGSGPGYAAVFDAVRLLGADVLTHPVNRGKGAALKTGFAHVARARPGHDVVCADGDGQHAVRDVLRVAAGVRATGATVLGARSFAGRVPLRSRLGNAVTRGLFRLATRSPVRDTQTGLRGYPADLLGWLVSVPGERFEYELSLLLRAPAAGHRVEEIPIDTIYLESNASSHFRPLVDSARVYAPLLRFCLSSFTGFVLDAVLLVLLQSLTGSLVASVAGARAASSTVNFLTNRHLVFHRAERRALRSAAARYWSLVALLGLANLVLISVLTAAGIGLLVAKVLTEVSLFATGYVVQRRLVFARGDQSSHPPHRDGAGSTQAQSAEFSTSRSPALLEQP